MRWVSSDWHLFHKNIRLFEPGRPENFEKVICDNILEYVAPNDEMWVLGDVSFGSHSRTIACLQPVLKDRQVYLVRGNHDKRTKDHHFKAMGFKHIYPLYAIVGERLLSHYPLTAVDPRYADEISELNGVFVAHGLRTNVHGHTHSKFSPNPKCINICVDVRGMRPVYLDGLRDD